MKRTAIQAERARNTILELMKHDRDVQVGEPPSLLAMARERAQREKARLNGRVSSLS